MTTMAHNWKPSEAQVNLLKTIFAERVAPTEAGRDNYWRNLTQGISNRESFQTALDALKARPKVLADPPGRQFLLGNGDVKTSLPTTCPAPYCNQGYGHQGGHGIAKRTDIATEPGLYRNPEDGTLYKLGKAANAWTAAPVSVYSNKATVRRLTVEGQMVKKGKWTKLTAYEARQFLAVSPKVAGPRLLAEWFMTDEDKNTWAVGFCLFCSKPLIDAVSVFNSIGPKCSKDRGIERDTPPEHLVAEIEKTVLAK